MTAAPNQRRAAARSSARWALAAGLTAACGDPAPAVHDAADRSHDATVSDAASPTADAPPADGCTPNPCTAPHQTVCTDVGGHPQCGCEPGYHDDRGVCVVDSPPSDDDHGDTFAAGTPMRPDTQLQAGIIETAGDEDWFRIPLVAERVYGLATAPTGTTLAAAVFAPGGGAELAGGASPRWKATAAGIYGIRITRPGGFTGGYTLQVADHGRDDYGDELAAAVATVDAAVATDIAGALQFPHDRDWIPLAVTSGRRYQFEFTAQAALADYEVYAADGARLWFGTNAYITAPSARLFVKVFDTAEFYGVYTLRATEAP